MTEMQGSFNKRASTWQHWHLHCAEHDAGESGSSAAYRSLSGGCHMLVSFFARCKMLPCAAASAQLAMPEYVA